MAIGVSGLMTGLDTETIITKMMEVDRRPVLLLQRKEAAYQAKISAFGALKGALAELQFAVKDLKRESLFTGFSASSGNTTALTVSASSKAKVGSWQVTVDALATAQQVKSSAFSASDEVVGTGTLTIQVGDNSAVNITIDETNNTLAGIAQAINASGADVTAGVVNDGLGNNYLTLAGKETGSGNTISLTMADDDGINDDANGLSRIYDDSATQSMSQTQAAGNAQLNVNGINVERAGNTIDDLLEGVTLSLKAADPGKSFEVKVTRDTAGIISKISAFIEKYNAVLGGLKELQVSDPKAGKAGLLQGESMPRILQARLQGLIHAKVSGVAAAANGLSALGFSADKDGKLSLNTATFTAAYEANREEVVNFFTRSTEGSEGFAGQMDGFLDSYLKGSTGLLAAKDAGLKRSIEHIGDQVERIELRLAKREENLRLQFESLESLMGQFQNTSGILNQQLEALTNLNAQISRNRK